MLANWSAIAFLLAAAGLVVFMLVVPRLLGGRSSGSQKQETFEAGVVSAGSARIGEKNARLAFSFGINELVVK